MWLYKLKKQNSHVILFIDMTKMEQQKTSITLRKQGFSYNDILKQVPVSKSTLSRWFNNIPFKPNNEFVERIKKNRSNLIDNRKKVKILSEKEAANLANNDVGKISKRDLFMLGLGIYMGEGSKTVCLRLSNSDPTIIKTGVTWFKKIYGLSNKNFMIRIHLYPDCNIEDSIQYWSRQTGLPKNQFHPVYIDKRINKNTRNNRKLLFGTAHVTIHSGKKREFGILLMRRVLNSIEIAKDRAGLV